MCVIIVREPGVTIPFDKLKSACIVNGDGYGISVMDRGKIETLKSFDPKGNDAEAVARRLEDAKDQKVALHLRFRTAGEKHIDSCHPFEVLTKASDDFQISFMHNGTLPDFTVQNSHLPDSHFFNKAVIKPTIQKFCAGMEASEVLRDPTLPIILKAFALQRSKFVLYDQNGEVLIINKDLGKTFEGWWASNEYSFNRTHRDPPNYSSGVYSGNAGSPHNVHRPEVWAQGRSTPQASRSLVPLTGTAIHRAANGTGSVTESGADDTATEPFDTDRMPYTPTADGKNVASLIGHNKRNLNSLVITPPVLRETFCDLTGCSSLSEAGLLEDEDVVELVDSFPEIAVVLILDLLHELYIKNQAKMVGNA